MNTTAFNQNGSRQGQEPFVIQQDGDGFRVFSAMSPANQYVVSGLPHQPQCSCRGHRDQNGLCAHIHAVMDQQGLTPRNGNGAIQPENGHAPMLGHHGNGNGIQSEGQMLLKRSISPDGRIDSLSIEFALPAALSDASKIQAYASHVLGLQQGIVSSFLGRNGSSSHQPANNGYGSTGATPARVIGVGSMPGKWGRRLFLNIQVGSNVLKFFGSDKQLADVLGSIGNPIHPQQVAEGLELNASCMVITKPSPDGRYVNIDQILAATEGRVQ